MMPPAKQMDPLLGVDIHLIQPPGPVPPVPIPHPFIGMVLDPMEFAPIIGATVMVHGMPAAIAGIEVKAIPPHIPMGGAWVPPPPGNEGEIFMGSATVSFDGDAASHLLHPVLTCQSVGMPKPPRPNPKKKPKAKTTLMLPTTIVLPIPGAPPVLIGGPPTISLMALGMKLGMAALGKAFKKFAGSNLAKKLKDKFKKLRQKIFKNMKPGFLKCKILKAEPVNSITGEVVVEQQDFSIDGRIPIEWNRTYGSQSEYNGVAGKGWQTPADMRLEIDEDGHVLFYDGGPGATVFSEIPVDPYSKQTEYDEEVVATPAIDPLEGVKLYHQDGRFSVHTKEGRIYRFERPAQKLRTHRRAPIVMYIDEIADDYDNYLRFVRNGRRELLRIEESAGRAVVIHSQNGLIKEMVFSHPGEPGKYHPLIRYDHDKDQNLITVYDALDVPYRFFYKNDKIVRHMDRNGLSFYYEYDSDRKDAKCIHAYGDKGLYDYHFDYKPYLTVYTDSLGNKKFLQYNTNNLPIREWDAIGDVARYEYDDFGRTTAVVDGEKHRTEYAYDEVGNLTKLTRPDGNSYALIYDTNNNMMSVTDPNGHTWGYEWNNRRRLLSMTTPLGAKSDYLYDQYGQLQSLIDPRGAQTAIRVDRFGSISGFVDALGSLTQYETDVLGNIIKEVSPESRITRYVFDWKSQLLRVVNPSGTKVSFAYDNEGNLTHHKDEAGHVTKLKYGGVGEVVKRTNADGSIVRYIYDAEEQLIVIVNERNQPYNLKRDLRGRIIEEVDYWGNRTSYQYDKSGFLVRTEDALGRITKYKNDQLGRLEAKKLYDGKEEAFVFDGNGNLIEHENEHIRCVRVFDAENRLVEEKQGDFKVENDYDENGNRIRRRSSIGNDISYSYDLNNKVIGVQINNEPLFSIERSRDGLTTREMLCGHLKRDYRHNRDGFVSSQLVHNEMRTYSDRRYEYDPTGNLKIKTDTKNGDTKYFYDQVGRLIKRINPQQQVEHFLYDPAGDILKSNHKRDPDTNFRKSTFDGIDYYFDNAGNLVRRDGSEGSIKFEWDGNDRLFCAENESGQIVELQYDAHGRRISKFSETSKTSFGWDDKYLLYDEVNHLGAREFVYYPDTHIPLAQIEKNKHVYYFQNDVNGLPQELCASDGTAVWSVGYGPFGKIEVDESTYINTPIRFQGQYHDEELGLYYNRFRYYDPGIGSFISQDPLGLAAGENVYGYAPNHWVWIDPLGMSCTKSVAQLAADRAQKNGWRSKCAATLTIGNRVFTGFSGRVGKLHPQLKKALANVPAEAREKWIGNCAEMAALNKALKAGFDPAGGISEAIRVGGKKHGTAKPTCKSCQDVLSQFGIQFPEM